MSLPIREPVINLPIHLYRGNALTLRLTIAGTGPLPEVTCEVRHKAGGELLNENLIPEPTTANRTVSVPFVNTGGYPGASYHRIKFNGKTILAGPVVCDYQTVEQPGGTVQDITVNLSTGIDIAMGTPNGTGITNAVRFNVDQLEYWNGSAWIALPIPMGNFVTDETA